MLINNRNPSLTGIIKPLNVWIKNSAIDLITLDPLSTEERAAELDGLIKTLCPKKIRTINITVVTLTGLKPHGRKDNDKPKKTLINTLPATN